MTDIETLKAMLDRANIRYEIIPLVPPQEPKDGTIMSVAGGYSGFVSEFKFKSDGSLMELGAYE